MMLADLFPDEDYRFQMRFERGAPADFFRATNRHDTLIAERRHWLQTSPEHCMAILPDAVPLLHETIEFAEKWTGFSADKAKSPAECLSRLGEFWETDFLLLRADSENQIRLFGGCVCFPSSWSLEEKIGRPVSFIHDVVPGLNANLGNSIHGFLSRIKPDIAWLRFNWGLSRSSELNQHPARNLPRLDTSVRLEEVFLRVEHQVLVALPKSRGILFGIRIEVHPLTKVHADTLAARRLSRALKTMPDEMARYKNILASRERILQLLDVST